ncbi:MAG: glycosyltransferase [Bacilli bacterium]|jgi:dolichyl-phosphate beta-glucosyltransferase|nr:glycosyltransferase [Bacilli bacterium]
MDIKKLSIIIPCYNEGKKIRRNLEERVLPFLKERHINYEIILVNDGSKDNTKELFNVLVLENVLPLGYDRNRGKGGAVKFGIEHATGDYVLFMDADLSTDLKALDLIYADQDDADMYIGSRHLKESVLAKKQGVVRRFVGRSCRIIVNTTFKFKFKDTQCGFKLIKTEYAKEMASRQIINGFAFDVEYLYMAQLNDLKIKEIPVIWENDEDSKVSTFKSSIRFFKDVQIIKKNRSNYFFAGK